MSKEPTDVMIAAYYTIEPARTDFQAVHDSGAKIEGAVCVTRDHAGKIEVDQEDHLMKKGAEAVGAAGFVIGLFAPPLLLATAIGAAIGGGLGELAHSKVKSKLEAQAFEAIPYGGAALVVAYPRSSSAEVEKAVTHALKTAVGEADGKKVDALKKALGEAQHKMA